MPKEYMTKKIVIDTSYEFGMSLSNEDIEWIKNKYNKIYNNDQYWDSDINNRANIMLVDLVESNCDSRGYLHDSLKVVSVIHRHPWFEPVIFDAEGKEWVAYSLRKNVFLDKSNSLMKREFGEYYKGESGVKL